MYNENIDRLTGTVNLATQKLATIMPLVKTLLRTCALFLWCLSFFRLLYLIISLRLPKEGFGKSIHEFSTNLNVNSRIKKKQKTRTAFTANQVNELEKLFNHKKYITPSERIIIADQIGITPTQVNWLYFKC